MIKKSLKRTMEYTMENVFWNEGYVKGFCNVEACRMTNAMFRSVKGTLYTQAIQGI